MFKYSTTLFAFCSTEVSRGSVKKVLATKQWTHCTSSRCCGFLTPTRFFVCAPQAEKVDAALHSLLMKLEPQRQHLACLGTWILYHNLRIMIQYLLSGFELELYSMHEYYYIYWWEHTQFVAGSNWCVWLAQTPRYGTQNQISLQVHFGSFVNEYVCFWL